MGISNAMMAVLAPAVVAALVVGFLAGLLTFKRSLRWCPQCGETLRCPYCPRQPPTLHSIRVR